MNNLEEIEDLPTREGGPIRRFGYNARCADGPSYGYSSRLRRFLSSMAGQEWDYIHSSIVKRAKDGAKWAKWSIKHTHWVVDFDCTECDGKVFDPRGLPVESWGRPQMYVCEGILKRAPQRPKYIPFKRIMPTEGLNYYEMDKAFFEVHFREFDRSLFRTEFDVLTKTSLTYSDSLRKYGGLISWKKRQLSKREAKKLGLEHGP